MMPKSMTVVTSRNRLSWSDAPRTPCQYGHAPTMSNIFDPHEASADHLRAQSGSPPIGNEHPPGRRKAEWRELFASDTKPSAHRKFQAGLEELRRCSLSMVRGL